MKIVNYNELAEAKKNFLNKHDDWSVETSPMDEYGTYYKIYHCNDGAQWIETYRPIYDRTTIEIRGVTIPVTVKLFETEAYNTDNPQSLFYYEKFYHKKETEIWEPFL